MGERYLENHQTVRREKMFDGCESINVHEKRRVRGEYERNIADDMHCIYTLQQVHYLLMCTQLTDPCGSSRRGPHAMIRGNVANLA